jgi:copper chaperone
MGCGGCVTKARKVLDDISGVTVEDVAVGSAKLSYDPARTSPNAITEALSKAGYPVRDGDATTPADNGGHCAVRS